MAYTAVNFAYREMLTSTKMGLVVDNIAWARDRLLELGVGEASADTGWRDISGARDSAYSGGTLQVRRVGDVVELRIDNLTRTASGSGALVALTSGFGASSGGVVATRFALHTAATTPAMVRGSIAGGAVSLFNAPATTAMYGGASWLTTDPFPSGTLPGTAVAL